MAERREAFDLASLKQRYEYEIIPLTDCEPPEYVVRLWQNGVDSGIWALDGLIQHARSPQLLRHQLEFSLHIGMGIQMTERVRVATVATAETV